MKHVFILNPAAGKHQSALDIQPKMEAFFAVNPMEHSFHVTTRPDEATEIARRESAEGEVRVYACGGDGTVLEVLNGIAEAPHAELACVPCGSGNDFLRIFPNSDLFRDPINLVNGAVQPVDIIRCGDKLSLNICSMGMDANVAERVVRYKRLPLVSGSMAYNLALVRTICGRIVQRYHIIMETENGRVEREGEYLFALAANGQYYGGGFRGAPYAKPDDGLLDFVLIEGVNHLKFLRLVGGYKKGKHPEYDCCEVFRGTKMQVIAEKPAVVTADGECIPTQDITFSVVPGAVSFVFPAVPDEDLSRKCKNLPIKA